MRHYLVLFQLTVLLLIGSNKIEAFFTNHTFSYEGTRNISCGLQIDYYSLLPFQRNVTGSNGILNMTQVASNDFCFIEQINITTPNATVLSTISAGVINGYDNFKQYVSGRCSSGQFWPSVTPIGYGACTQLSYETQAVQLCICSTDNCNLDYSTCVASVQATQSVPPPNLPTYFPDLTNVITCDQSYQGLTYSDMYHGTGWIYNEYTPFNMSQVRAYQSTYAVACLLYVNVQTGDWYKFPAMYESYGSILYQILREKKMNTLIMYVESLTSVSVQRTSVYYTNTSLSWQSSNFTEIVCLCTTNNCNQNLSTCAIILNTSVSTTTSTTLLSTNNTIPTTITSSVAQNTTGSTTTRTTTTTSSAFQNTTGTTATSSAFQNTTGTTTTGTITTRTTTTTSSAFQNTTGTTTTRTSTSSTSLISSNTTGVIRTTAARTSAPTTPRE